MELEFNLKKLLWSVLLSMGEPVSAKKFQEFIHRSFPDRFMALSELKLAVEEMNAKLAGDGAPEEIGRARVGKECRSRWSPYH